MIEVFVVCLFCDEPLDDPDEIWCPDCEDGDDAPESSAARTAEDRSLLVAA